MSNPDDILTAMIANLATAAAAWPAGKGQVPDGSPHEPGVNDHYFVVHYLGYAGVRDSTMDKDRAIQREMFQVDVVATSAEQCGWGKGKAEEAMAADLSGALWQLLSDSTGMVPGESGLWTCSLTYEIATEGAA